MMMRFRKPSGPETPSKFLYVSGIGHSLRTRKADIEQVFSPYGILVDILFQENKGFVFVWYQDMESAVVAKTALNNTCIEVFHVKIYITFAEVVNDDEEEQSSGIAELECTSTTEHVRVSGLEVIDEFISHDEEDVILSDDYAGDKSLLWKDGLSRRVQHYGYTFNYRTVMLDYNTHDTPPFNSLYTTLALKIQEAVSPALAEPLTQLTLNEYLPGQGIASHTDTESCFGPDLFVLSVGSGVTMTLSTKESEGECSQRKLVYLRPRSLLCLRADARYLWRHMIAPRKNDKVQGQVMPRGRRVSLTFRQALLPGDIASSRLCASQVEYEHVYKVYDSIALHWHHTRGKRKVHWHRVKSFLDALAPGSFMADIGSGDGKYFGLNPSCLSIGCDRSLKLLEVSKNVSFESFCCDAVKVPFRSDIFDAVICIAVLHHMASIDRRVSVVRELLRICRVGGRVMLQAWAMEQESGSKKNFSEQDVLVPWKLQKHFQSEEKQTSSTSEDLSSVVEENGSLVYQRYCHVYKQGELEDLCSGIPGCRIVESGFDKGNWFVHFEKVFDDRLLSLATVGPTSTIPDMHYRNRDRQPETSH